MDITVSTHLLTNNLTEYTQVYNNSTAQLLNSTAQLNCWATISVTIVDKN
jgi:hypothetical protein